MAKTKYTSGVTIVTADIANSWFGGLAGTAEGAALPANDPRVAGHLHDGQNRDGSAGKINLVNHVTGQLGSANLANGAVTNLKLSNDAVTNAKILDGTITESKLAFSITSPVVAPETFVFRPSGTAEGNVYNDFAALYADMSAATGTKVLVIDDSIASPATIPSGTYDFENVHLTGIHNSLSFPLSIPSLAFSSGTVIRNLSSASNIYFRVINTGLGSPLVYDSGGTEVLRLNYCSMNVVASGDAIISVSGGTTIQLDASYSTISARSIFVEGISSDILLATLTNDSSIGLNTLSGGASGTASVSLDSTSSLSPLQGSFTGTLSPISLLSRADSVYFDDSLALPALDGGGDSDLQTIIDALKGAGGGGGGETLAGTLAIGNQTSTHDIIVNDDDSVFYGTGSDIRTYFNSAANSYTIKGTNVSDAGAVTRTSNFEFVTGDRVTTDASVGTDSGSFAIATGDTGVTAVGGTAGDSGLIYIATGDATSTLGSSGNSGALILLTGGSDELSSGNISLTTGNSKNASGSLILQSGNSSASTSGNITLETGTALGSRGTINLNSVQTVLNDAGGQWLSFNSTTNSVSFSGAGFGGTGLVSSTGSLSLLTDSSGALNSFNFIDADYKMPETGSIIWKTTINSPGEEAVIENTIDGGLNINTPVSEIIATAGSSIDLVSGGNMVLNSGALVSVSIGSAVTDVVRFGADGFLGSGYFAQFGTGDSKVSYPLMLAGGQTGVNLPSDPENRLYVRGEDNSVQMDNINLIGGFDMISMDITQFIGNPTVSQKFINFKIAGVSQGYISGDGAGSITYSPFTGCHRGIFEGLEKPDIGMIVVSTGAIDENYTPRVSLAKAESDSRVMGVLIDQYTNYDNNGLPQGEELVHYNAVGDGFVLVTNKAGDVQNGDLIESSSIPGYGQKQSDNIFKSSTVAKCTQDVDWNSVSDMVNGYKYKMVSCTYHCG